MQFKIKTKNKSYSFYISVIRNKFIFDKLKEVYFNEKNKYKNCELIKKEYLKFADDCNQKHSDEIIEFHDLITPDLREWVFPVRGYSYFTGVFVVNFYYNAILNIFKDNDYIKLFTLMEGHPEDSFASVINGKKNTEWLINTFKNANNDLNIKPSNYFIDRNGIDDFLKDCDNENHDTFILQASWCFDLDDIDDDDFFYKYENLVVDDETKIDDPLFLSFYDDYDWLSLEDGLTYYKLKKQNEFDLFVKYINENKKYPSLNKKILDDFSFNLDNLIKSLIS